MRPTPLDVLATTIEPSFQMWVTLALVVLAIVAYATEALSVEVTSLGILALLLLLFHAMPVAGPDGRDLLPPEALLMGFANPALITVIALLVVGQGLVRTGALDRLAGMIGRKGTSAPYRALAAALLAVAAISAVLNNTPVVLIFIPILQAFATRMDASASRVMIPLSFAAILGGMTTLIGSSTNLLVSSALIEYGLRPLSFFEFTVPGLILAGVGLLYVAFLLPRLLPDRATLAGELIGEGKQFIAQIVVTPESELNGQSAVGGLFKALPDMTVRMIQRGEHAFLPPFEDVALQPGDVLIIAATRKALTESLKRTPDLLVSGDGVAGDGGDQARSGGGPIIAEVMVAPTSPMIGRTLEQVGFRYTYNCIVLGIQRRARMIRTRMTEIRLEAGDVLLIQGRPEDVEALRTNREDVVLIEWSSTELPATELARRATAIFAGVVVLGALDVVPIVVAAVLGATAMILVGPLSIGQAARAVDRSIILLVGTALALGAAMQATGAAAWLAQFLVGHLHEAGPTVILSGFFLLVAVMTNVLSNNACAVLFTPIGVGIAQRLGIDPFVFAYAVVFAANCSFATPIGYQTNLLVLGPGHYRFSDFLRAGTPLILVVWLVFSLVAPVFYGL